MVEFAVAVGVPQILESLQPRRKERHPALKMAVTKDGRHQRKEAQGHRGYRSFPKVALSAA